jgi:hypothetical protein
MFGSGGPNPREQQRSAISEQLQQRLTSGIPGVGGQTLQLNDDVGDLDNNPLGGVAIAYADPIAEAMANLTPASSGGGTAIREDLSAIYARTIVQGAKTEQDVFNHMLSLVKQLGIKRDDILQSLGQVYAKRPWDDNRMQVYSSTLSQMTGWSPEKIQAEIKRYAGAK